MQDAGPSEPCQAITFQHSWYANGPGPDSAGALQPAAPEGMQPIHCPAWPTPQPQLQEPQLQQTAFGGGHIGPEGSMEASASILHMHLPEAAPPSAFGAEGGVHNSMGLDFCGAQLEGDWMWGQGSPDATGTTCAAESPRSRLGLKRKSNSLAQRRYRAKQKEKTQGLHETLQQLASKVSELEVVKKACATLQV